MSPSSTVHKTCPFCGGSGFRKEPGSLMERCSWCSQPPLPADVARTVATERQDRIEQLLG